MLSPLNNTMPPLVASESYNAMLTRFLVNGLSRSLAQVQQCAQLVPDEVRVRAWNQLSYAFRSPTAWPETRQLLLTLAPKMEQAGFREEWIAYLSSGVESGQACNDLAAIAEFELQIAMLYRMVSEYERAVQRLDASIEHFRVIEDRRGQARALNELAWVEQLRRHYDEASHHIEQALMLLDGDDLERGLCYRTQGMIAIYRGEWQQAEAHHRAALALFEQRGDIRKTAWSKQNLGLSLRGQKRFDEAIQQFNDAVAIMRMLADDYHWMTAQLNLGATFYYSGKVDKAIGCYREVESMALKLHDKLRLADVYVNLGLAYLAQNENETSSKSFQKSIQLFEELGIHNMVINSMDGLAMSYIAQRDYNQAIQVLEAAIEKLPLIVNVPLFAYHEQSLNKHWQEAKSGQELLFLPQAELI